MTNFYISVNLGGNPSVPGNATSYQIVTPWGQTDVCLNWYECLNQAFGIGSTESGRQGIYFNTGATNGLTTASQTAPSTATPIRNG